MSNFMNSVKNLIKNNRREWIGLISLGYQIETEQAWRAYGYASREEFRKDLLASVKN